MSISLRSTHFATRFGVRALSGGVQRTVGGDNNVVNCHTEWDPLEEVIVGRVENATVPKWHQSLKSVVPKRQRDFFKSYGGKPFPLELIKKAQAELGEFCRILEAEGVKVVRPDKMDHSEQYNTPDFPPTSGLYGAMPRDVIIAIGNELIEAPMAWRSRYFEYRAYRTLMKHYFKQGARWTTAPKPQMNDSLYDDSFDTDNEQHKGRSVVTEFEPVFDAAEFSRCGKDIFVQLSQVTNRFGIEWMRRHLGPDYRIHILEIDDPNAMHIDGTFVPLAPGRLLLNPIRHIHLPEFFKDWEVLYAPPPEQTPSLDLYFTSPWLSMNLLSLDEKRVCVEAHEQGMIDFLKKHGFEPVKVPFQGFMPFGGAFHCATADIRRRGSLQSYFPMLD